MRLDQGERGYAMAALLVSLSVMAVLMSAAMPVWSQYAQREREEELIWRGQQYARAIGLFQRKYANTFPPTVDVLVQQRFLRKKYKDPVTGDDFQVIPATGMSGGGIVGGGPVGGAPGMPPMPGAPPGSTPAGAAPQPAGPPARMTSVGGVTGAGSGVQGVVSKSDKASIKMYNGRTKYNEWAFVHMVSSQTIGPGGQPVGGAPGTIQGPGGTTFTPFGGSDRRPGVGQPPGTGAPSPFGPPPPFGQPSGPPVSNPPSPFGAPQPPSPPPPGQKPPPPRG